MENTEVYGSATGNPEVDSWNGLPVHDGSGWRVLGTAATGDSCTVTSLPHNADISRKAADGR